MPSLLRMPAPAAGVQQALLLEWSVDENATFAVPDVLAVVETDKAVIEIEAESDGMLHRRLIPAGQQVHVGTPIAVIGSPGDTADQIAALAAQVDGQRIFASPIARRMAKQAALTLAEISGTGPGGRIVRRDVEAATAARRRQLPEPAPTAHGPAASPPAAAAAPAVAATAATAARTAGTPTPPAPAGSTSHPTERTYTDHPHSKIRTAIAARLTQSKQTVPHFYLRATARVDDLLALRAELNAGDGPPVSINDLVVRAVARAHRAVPEMNVTYADSAVRQYDFVDVAVAVATDAGLLTPVVRDADRLTITQIAAATADLSGRARNGRLRQQELEGGSITVTNLGMFGVEEFGAIINPPQSAILAVGAARAEPMVAGTQVVAATVLHLVLSVDHRPLDGVLAARWMSALTALLEHPVRILA